MFKNVSREPDQVMRGLLNILLWCVTIGLARGPRTLGDIRMEYGRPRYLGAVRLLPHYAKDYQQCSFED